MEPEGRYNSKYRDACLFGGVSIEAGVKVSDAINLRSETIDLLLIEGVYEFADEGESVKG